MKLKTHLLLIITSFALLLSANSHAGRQGINFYYGLGIGATAPANNDVAATGEVMFGIEEDGWALEVISFSSVETGTDVNTVDYSVSGSHIGLTYRTIEQNNSWYKFKVSGTNMDFDDSDLVNDVETSGLSYTIGWGLRMSRNARFEVDYSFYNSSDLQDPVHNITARYFWGGSEYLGKSF